MAFTNELCTRDARQLPVLFLLWILCFGEMPVEALVSIVHISL